MLLLIAKAFMFGIFIAAPLGPMGVLCMRRTMSQGWKSGVATALGIATGDGIFAAISLMGFAGISEYIASHTQAFHLITGLFIGGFGLTILLSKPTPIAVMPEGSSVSYSRAFSSALLMTLTNPLTILFFTMVFAALTAMTGFDKIASILVIIAIFIGSLTWYCGIIISVWRFHHMISDRKRLFIDRIAAVFLIAFGIWGVLKAL